MGRMGRIATGAALVVLAAGCAEAARPGPPQLGQPAPPIAAATLAGDTVSLASLEGQVVLLNMWATWCAPCRAETPFLQEIYERYHEEGFEIVGISMDTRDAADQIAMFTEEYGVTYTILHDPQGKAMELYQILGLPGTFLVDREGVLRWMMYGPVSETNTAFFKAIEDALR